MLDTDDCVDVRDFKKNIKLKIVVFILGVLWMARSGYNN